MAVAEFLAQRARSNVEDLVQKRRDLDIAHEILLRIGMEHDRDRGVALRNEVAQARERVREQPATRPLEALVREVRRTARREPQVAWRSLRGLYERALEANDARLAEAARAALEPMMPSREPMRAMLESSERDDLIRWFGEQPPAHEGPNGLREAPKASTADDLLADLAFSLKPEQLTAFELAAGCARYFDVEARPPARRDGEGAPRAAAGVVPHPEHDVRAHGRSPRRAQLRHLGPADACL